MIKRFLRDWKKLVSGNTVVAARLKSFPGEKIPHLFGGCATRAKFLRLLSGR